MHSKRWALPLVLASMALLLLLPAGAGAQSANASISGIVKDTSGAVLPGVTVEAASPALIEKVRSVTTDGEGQFKIVDLRPGTYSVTFSLTGFTSVKRDGIELAAGFTATVNADLKVGSVEETIVVSGAAPIVDVQSNKNQKLLAQEVLEALPTQRMPQSYTPMILGVQGGVLGTSAPNNSANLTIHGSVSNASNIAIDGFENNSMAGSGGIGFTYYVNQAYVQEMSVEVGGQQAEVQKSGVRTNVVPKTGSNNYTGFLFLGYAGHGTQAGNLTDALKNTGLTSVNSVDKIWDVNPAWGGPIIRDKLWFYNAYRYWGSSNYVAGMYQNATPTAWTYTPDFNHQATNKIVDYSADVRLTWQASQKANLTMFYDAQPHKTLNRVAGGTQGASVSGGVSLTSPEATQDGEFWPNHFGQAKFRYAASNRLFLEGGISSSWGAWNARRQSGVALDTIAVLEQSTNVWYRASPAYGQSPTNPVIIRASAQYVTGSHALKFGMSDIFGRYIRTNELGQSMTYRFLNGTPNQLTQYIAPSVTVDNLDADLGLYAQDQWTVKHLTINAGVRYDYFHGSVPAQDEAALLQRFGLPLPAFSPARSYAAVDNVPVWKDVSPRLGVVYDLSGDGKTAVKASLGRYVSGQMVEIADANNPFITSVSSVTRNWTDANKDFVPNCDLTNTLANGECGQVSNLNFGSANPTATRYATDVTQGNRNYNWELEAGVQRELMKGFSVGGAYYRRWYGNFTVTQNTSTSPTDYTSYCITTPVDSRLPGGGGQTVCNYYDVNPAKFGVVTNLVTQSSNFGKQEDVYDGYAINTDIRLGRNLKLQGGIDSGRERTNNCYVMNQPNLSGLAGSPNSLPFCDVRPPMLTQAKFFGVYRLPWYDIQISAAYQNLPGPQITATYTATNAQIAPSLGRNLSSGANGTASLAIIAPGTMYGPRTQSLDSSIRKTFRVMDHTKVTGSLEIFNIMNRSDILSYNTTYGPAWLRPTNILPGRWLKFGVQIDY